MFSSLALPTMNAWSFVVTVIMYLSFLTIVASVALDFFRYHHQGRQVVREGRSLVETGSMSLFFIGYYLVLRFNFSVLVNIPSAIRVVLIVSGLLLVVLGTVANVWGRFSLKSQWANQIKIYKNHQLIKTGPYSIVRHPLYASLIWIFTAVALIYANPLALMMNLTVFVPMMYFRARKEDALLARTFGEDYNKYKAKTGMFVPRWRRL